MGKKTSHTGAKLREKQKELGLCQGQLMSVDMYFKEYGIKDHYIAWVDSKNREGEAPPKLIEDGKS